MMRAARPMPNTSISCATGPGLVRCRCARPTRPGGRSMIRGLWFLSFNSLAFSGRRWLLTLLAVALGVAGIVATQPLNNALIASLDRTARAVLGQAEAALLAMDERGFNPDTLAAVQGVSGVAQAVPRSTKLVAYRLGTATGFLRLTGIDP